jgi:Flp pilus assembly protein TadD
MSGFLYSSPGFDVGQRLQSGFTALQKGRLEEAWRAFSEVIDKAPDNAAAHHMRGLVYVSGGLAADGIPDLRRAVQLDPRDAVAASNLAMALHAVGGLEEGLAAADAAVALDPNLADGWLNRGNILGDLARPDEAVASYDRALALRPGDGRLHNNKGNALKSMRRLDEAAASFKRAMQLSPCIPEIAANCGFAHLAMGDLRKGFGLFEARWGNQRMKAYLDSRGFTAPFWRGQEDIAGKTLLLHSEQGFGDVLQFCRYAPLAAGRGARVVVEVDPALAALMRTLKGVETVIAQGEALPPIDLHCPMMSLPHAFGTTLETVPGETPYLWADPALVEAWRARLGPSTRPRVGLCWSSGVRPDQPELTAVNGRRNLPLEKLTALKGLNVDFVSLQKGQPAEAQFDALDTASWDGPPILNVAADLTDFSQTAALMMVLDLIVSVDTSTPHLAGALGRPVWVMNRFDPCWRWLRDRDDSPWYPTARLFRQPQLGDWDSVLAAVRAALQDVEGSRCRTGSAQARPRREAAQPIHGGDDVGAVAHQGRGVGRAGNLQHPPDCRLSGRRGLGRAPGLVEVGVRLDGAADDHNGDQGGRAPQFSRGAQAVDHGGVFFAGDLQAGGVADGLALALGGVVRKTRRGGQDAGDRAGETHGSHGRGHAGQAALGLQVLDQQGEVEVVGGDPVDVDQPGGAPRIEGGEGLDVQGSVGVADQDHRLALADLVQQAAQFPGYGDRVPRPATRG